MLLKNKESRPDNVLNNERDNCESTGRRRNPLNEVVCVVSVLNIASLSAAQTGIIAEIVINISDGYTENIIRLYLGIREIAIKDGNN